MKEVRGDFVAISAAALQGSVSMRGVHPSYLRELRPDMNVYGVSPWPIVLAFRAMPRLPAMSGEATLFAPRRCRPR